MTHLLPEQLQSYLADTLPESEQAAVADHLAQCTACSDALATLVADDAFLAEALDLSVPEMAWVESQDLTDAVLHQLRPRFAVSPGLIVAGLIGLPGLWIFGFLLNLGFQWLDGYNSVGGLIDMGQFTLPALFRFTIWLINGGLLTDLWPLFILGAGFLVWRLSHLKETNEYA